MKTYNKSEIMTAAHAYYRTGNFDSFADALKQSWANAKFRVLLKKHEGSLRGAKLYIADRPFDSLKSFGLYIMEKQSLGYTLKFERVVGTDENGKRYGSFRYVDVKELDGITFNEVNLYCMAPMTFGRAMGSGVYGRLD